MKYFVLAVLLASAYAAEETVEIAEAQMPFFPGGMMPWQGQNQYNPQGFAIDYSMGCSNSCGCQQQCVPWIPCQCRCPPPCPPVNTTPGPDEDIGVEECPPPSCLNGAANTTFPHCCANGSNNRYCCPNSATNMWCCLNGAANEFCCTNGANSEFCCENGARNKFCCLNGVTDNPFCCANGEMNPECLPEEEVFPTTTVGPDGCNGGGCCIPCIPCRPCQVWWQCQPCQNNCNNGCQMG